MFHCFTISYLKIKPKSRVKTISFVYDDMFFIFGGLNSTPLNDLWFYDFHSDNCWSEAHPGGLPPEGRYGHSAILLRNEVYFYGGNIAENQDNKDEILIFSICRV